MCEGAAPLPLLAHKRTATSLRTASACRSYLLAFNAHRDRIFQRERIRLHVPRRFRMLVHVPRMLRLRKSNGQSNCKQRYSENPQHGFKTFPHWFCASAP
jgi:hypothetical protein